MVRMRTQLRRGAQGWIPSSPHACRQEARSGSNSGTSNVTQSQGAPTCIVKDAVIWEPM